MYKNNVWQDEKTTYKVTDGDGQVTGIFPAVKKEFHLEVFIDGVILIPPESVTQDWRNINQPQLTLDQVKKNKRAEISAACHQAIIAGFYSDVSGESKLYGFNAEDQANYDQNWTLIKELGWPMVPLKCIGGTFQQYTVEQYRTFTGHGAAHKIAQLMKCDNLFTIIETAETLEELEAIVW